ncbi:MAG: YceI family protein [Sandaracinaceae bacterium]|nr:YceI family protein [Sandaracinaceae bacterium]
MRTTTASIASIAITLSLASAAAAQARTFNIANDGGSRIQFISDAPLETITGVSSHVTGDVTFDAANLSSTRGTVRVRVATIRTGIDLRDEHLRAENWLDANRYPDATFEITGVEGASNLQPNVSTRVRVRGRFSIHGVTRDIVANAQVRLIPLNDELRAARIEGDVLRVQASFNIMLTDYNVSVPAIVRLKVANEIRVNVTIRGVARPAS